MICMTAAEVAQSTTKINLELVLSIIAIVISVITIFIEFYGNQRVNRINLEANFYEKIYNDFLIDKIPNARNAIAYNNNIVSGADELIDVLNDMRRKSLFFKYKEEKFYNELCKKLQELENELVKKSDMELDNDNFCQFVENIKKALEEIYDIVLCKYTGKFIHKRLKGIKK